MIDLEARRKGIGGSDIAAILGLSPWKTPLEVWQEKTGRATPKEESQAMHWGKVLEDVIARHYAMSEKIKVWRVNYTITHKSLPLIASIDRAVSETGRRAVVKGEFRTDKILECKTVNAFAGREWGPSESAPEESIPVQYYAQVQHYLGILDIPYGDLAALIGGNDYRVYRLTRNDAQISAMQEKASQWWRDYVIKDVPPPPRTVEETLALFPRSKVATKTADNDAYLAYQKYVGAKETEKKAKEDVKKFKDILASFLGESDTLTDSAGNVLATYKSAKDSKKTDWEAIALKLAVILGRKCKLHPNTIRNIFEFNETTTPGARTLRAKGE